MNIPAIREHGARADRHTKRVVNVTDRLAWHAGQAPDRMAIIAPVRRTTREMSITFAELQADVERIARGFAAWGVPPGARLALLVRPGIEFITLVFAMLRAGIVIILIDPGMGRRHLVRCLEEVHPEGFVAIPLVHAVRRLLGNRFRQAKYNVTVGRSWWREVITLDELRRMGGQIEREKSTPGQASSGTHGDDPAAIIFTSGSTGPPKGVLYTHGVFDAQVEQIQSRYGIEPGEIDLPGFPLFGLFNGAMGVTTVIPEMDFTRPARVDPAKILGAMNRWKVTQAFGSPAMWNRVGRHCEHEGHQVATLRRVLSAGAAVPDHVIRRMSNCLAKGGELHTPYGATEALPVASISSREVLSETAAATADGRGVCVGTRFNGIEWKVIEATDESCESIDSCKILPTGQIGELIVRGPVVTREYVTRTEWNALSKIRDGATVWHRMGDVGYLDGRDRFWYCGRKSQRVAAADGILYTECCEAVANRHPEVFRSALVGVGPWGRQIPMLVVEPRPDAWPRSASKKRGLADEILASLANHPVTARIRHVLLRRSLPVDIRHNSKISREKLAVWASRYVSVSS